MPLAVLRHPQTVQLDADGTVLRLFWSTRGTEGSMSETSAPRHERRVRSKGRARRHGTAGNCARGSVKCQPGTPNLNRDSKHTVCMGFSAQAATEVRDSRSALRWCLSPWGDALFELCDAALRTSAPVGSVPSQSRTRVPLISRQSLQLPGRGDPGRRQAPGAGGHAPSEEPALGVRRRRLDLGSL
jgi:hypothetical protein